MESASMLQSLQHHPLRTASPTVQKYSYIPPSPTPGATTNTTASKRHTKGLSLNFPILLPTSIQVPPSPVRSGVTSPIDSARSSPRTKAEPFGIPDPSPEPQDKSKAHGNGDFLTLLAAQERKVLELKEELQRAETDLQILKKQWATHEANKKRDEFRQVKKLQPMAMDDSGGNEIVSIEENLAEERKRKRALVGKDHEHQAGTISGETGLSRKGSKRVFAGGRHTRTLSLLSPTSAKPYGRSSEDTKSAESDAQESETDHEQRLFLSRISTLDSLISGETMPPGYAKTFKDLATHRRSLPPVAADMLVKQGKQVFDGVKDGVWTFFEDIRQATVGEEGINGTVTQQRPTKQTQKKGGRKSSDKAGKSGAKSSAGAAGSGLQEPSFWKEFGLDTPQRQSQSATDRNGHVQKKDSTDSSNPPSLLPDLNDIDEVEDGWDAWDSPVSNKVAKNALKGEAHKPPTDRGGVLPWPQIQRVTPTKITRTISDLMKEWDSSQNGVADRNATRDDQMHILDGPHI